MGHVCGLGWCRNLGNPIGVADTALHGGIGWPCDPMWVCARGLLAQPKVFAGRRSTTPSSTPNGGYPPQAAFPVQWATSGSVRHSTIGSAGGSRLIGGCRMHACIVLQS
jgi:hypothetical protein